jgi:O-antigen biosynthesis protein
MTISVVIPAYENVIDVLQCLNSLQASCTPPIEFVIQDDCSPSVDLRSVIPPYAASVARNEVNLGFAGNCNRGAARAQGDIIAFVNQDIVADGNLSRGWDTTISAAFEDASVGVVAPRLVFPDGKIQSAGGVFDANCAPVHRCLGYSDLTNWEVNTPESVAWTTGAFLAIRRELFQKVGGFDERYIQGYFEDVALCLKVRELGYKTWYEPRVSFVHKVGSTGGSPHFYQNAQLFRKEWVMTNKIKPDLPVATVRYW